MKKKLRDIFCFLIVLTVYSCSSSKSICYQYQTNLETSINEVITKLNESKFSIKEGKKASNIFVLVDYEELKTTLTFNFYENMPRSIQKQIDYSNRFMIISGKKIPVLFYFDDGHSTLRVNGISHGIIGGYLIQFDSDGKVIMSGPVQ
ncbi:MAG: hypothetical protein MI974_32515 [Chitinophagales bacterium]|nr:hypothetical protein [Chitinophagales bacterium]